MLSGAKIYKELKSRVESLELIHEVPETIKLTKKNHKNFFDYLDSNPEKRGGSLEFGQVIINGVPIYIIPVSTCWICICFPIETDIGI